MWVLTLAPLACHSCIACFYYAFTTSLAEPNLSWHPISTCPSSDHANNMRCHLQNRLKVVLCSLAMVYSVHASDHSHG